jgi:hypothetical protein
MELGYVCDSFSKRSSGTHKKYLYEKSKRSFMVIQQNWMASNIALGIQKILFNKNNNK